MRHLNSGSKLGRNPAHRRATLRNLVTNVIEKERITTTVTRAKAARPLVERIITLGKGDSLHTRRQAAAFLMTPGATSKLLTISPRALPIVRAAIPASSTPVSASAMARSSRSWNCSAPSCRRRKRKRRKREAETEEPAEKQASKRPNREPSYPVLKGPLSTNAVLFHFRLATLPAIAFTRNARAHFLHAPENSPAVSPARCCPLRDDRRAVSSSASQIEAPRLGTKSRRHLVRRRENCRDQHGRESPAPGPAFLRHAAGRERAAAQGRNSCRPECICERSRAA